MLSTSSKHNLQNLCHENRNTHVSHRNVDLIYPSNIMNEEFIKFKRRSTSILNVVYVNSRSKINKLFEIEHELISLKHKIQLVVTETWIDGYETEYFNNPDYDHISIQINIYPNSLLNSCIYFNRLQKKGMPFLYEDTKSSLKEVFFIQRHEYRYSLKNGQFSFNCIILKTISDFLSDWSHEYRQKLLKRYKFLLENNSTEEVWSRRDQVHKEKRMEQRREKIRQQTKCSYIREEAQVNIEKV